MQLNTLRLVLVTLLSLCTSALYASIITQDHLDAFLTMASQCANTVMPSSNQIKSAELQTRSAEPTSDSDDDDDNEEDDDGEELTTPDSPTTPAMVIVPKQEMSGIQKIVLIIKTLIKDQNLLVTVRIQPASTIKNEVLDKLARQANGTISKQMFDVVWDMMDVLEQEHSLIGITQTQIQFNNRVNAIATALNSKKEYAPDAFVYAVMQKVYTLVTPDEFKKIVTAITEWT